MRNSKIKSMAIDAMFLAIMSLMTFIPQIGFISLGGVISFTLLHIVVLIGTALGNYKKGIIYGIMFGLLSLIKAATAPQTIFDPYFVNPLISVLPRVLFGLVAGLLFDLVKKVKTNSIKSVLMPIVCFITTIIHSVMVLGMLGLINGNEISSDGTYWATMGTILLSSGLAEATAAFIMVFPILVALNPKELTIKNEKDNSELLGNIGLCLAVVLPFVTWFVSAIGKQKAKHFENEKGLKKNKIALILSLSAFAIYLLIFMIVSN